MKRRGQAAMEFLMTYGWAILAAIIVIGVIAFYILPQVGTSGTSSVQQPFMVAQGDVQITATGIKIQLTYNGPDSANINWMNSTSGGTTCSNNSIVPVVTIPSGAKKEVTIGCSLQPGQNWNGKTTIGYNITSGTYNQVGTGTLVGKVPG